MSSSDSKNYNKPHDEWERLDDEIIRLDDPDEVNVYGYAEGRLQMAYGCYRVLKCKGAE